MKKWNVLKQCYICRENNVNFTSRTCYYFPENSVVDLCISQWSENKPALNADSFLPCRIDAGYGHFRKGTDRWNKNIGEKKKSTRAHCMCVCVCVCEYMYVNKCKRILTFCLPQALLLKMYLKLFSTMKRRVQELLQDSIQYPSL